jgi:hypothetical protein
MFQSDPGVSGTWEQERAQAAEVRNRSVSGTATERLGVTNPSR